MRLYLDQMFMPALCERLRAVGHNVIRAGEVGDERSDDEAILRSASSDGRILVTLDRHFGDWVVLPLREHEGVIRVRVTPTTTRDVAEILIPFLANMQQEDLKNHLVILSRSRARWIKTAR